MIQRWALEAFLTFFEELFERGRYNDADIFLDSLDVERIEPVVILGILTSTHASKGRLPSRPHFLLRAEDRLRATLGDTLATNLLRSRR